MNPIKKFCYRIYQKTMHLASYLLNFNPPEILQGEDALGKQLKDKLDSLGYHRPLLIITPSMLRCGAHAKLEEAHIDFIPFDKVEPNAPFRLVYEAKKAYLDNECDCLIALGGGSAIDIAKAAGALISNPKMDLYGLKGVLKVRKKPPYMIAVPTTAGSGSEATVAAVVMNEENHDKFAINDPKLIPDLAILDGELLISLPPHIISTTGMDALTHAVEAYIGHSNTKRTKHSAEGAVMLIRDYLYRFYLDPNDKEARDGMQRASFLAGVAFTRAYVGYVHALAHALGGQYGVAHGYANAVLLPQVLRSYGKKAHRKLAKLSDLLGLTEKGESQARKAEAFISWNDELNKSMEIPDKFGGLIKEEDIIPLAKHAEKEGNPLYPVPRIMDHNDLAKILRGVN